MASNSDHIANRWVNAHTLLNLAWVAVLLYTGNPWTWLWMLTVALSFAIYMLLKMRNLGFKPLGLGYANLVTTGRLALLLLMAANHNNLLNTTLFAGFLLIIILDGVDGKLARKYKQTCTEGEMLDAETDAQFVLALSWIHYDWGTIGWWILIPGGLRYLYQFLFFWLPSSDAPPKKMRATIAVIFFVSLTLPFIFPDSLSIPTIKGASALIFLSFGISLIKGIQLLLTKRKEV